MVRRFYNLPSLTTLAVFEASARHLSFTRAGRELNVTPGAVSRQIKSLEAEIGCPLFQRVHRGVVLTSEGEELHGVLSRAFSQTAAAFHHIKRQGGARSVTVGASTAFASLWLLPRLAAFWRASPEVVLNHVISDNPQDLRLAQVDLRIRYGQGAWPEEDAALLFPDRIYPVCAPEFAKRHEDAATAADLARLPLLQIDRVDPDGSSWDDWVTLLGQPRVKGADAPRSPRFNNYVISLQVAEEAQGVALGWDSLVRPLIEAGRLARITDLEIPAPGAFYITGSRGRELGSDAQVLRDWLIAEVARERALAAT